MSVAAPQGTSTGLPVAGLFHAPALEAPTPDETVPTVRRNPVEIPDWLFENRVVPLSEQYGITFQSSPALKSLRTAWLLSLAFGVLGVDRFYLAKPATGALKLATAGGLGIWWLLDLLRLTRADAADGRRAPLAGSPALREALGVLSAVLISAILGLGVGTAAGPVTAAATGTYESVRVLLNPPPPPPVQDWHPVADTGGTGTIAPIVTTAGRIHVTYTFAAPAVVYFQPETGPAVMVGILEKPGTGARNVDLPPGTYTLTVSTTGTDWTLKAEEYRYPLPSDPARG